MGWEDGLCVRDLAVLRMVKAYDVDLYGVQASARVSGCDGWDESPRRRGTRLGPGRGRRSETLDDGWRRVV